MAKLGGDLGVEMSLLSIRKAYADPFMGFNLRFHRGSFTEDQGFGQCHKYNTEHRSAEATNEFTITVKFPRGQFVYSVGPIDGSLRDRIPDPKASLLRVSLQPGSQVVVEGFGMPFSNPGYVWEAWVARNKPCHLAGDKTLVDVLRQRDFCFVVAQPEHILGPRFGLSRLAEPYNYAYGNAHEWNVTRNQKEMLLPEFKGHQYAPLITFKDDDTHMAIISQSVVQDTMWIAKAAAEIFGNHFFAYFVEPIGDDHRRFVILPLSKEFRQKYDVPWKRLTSADSFGLALFDSSVGFKEPKLENSEYWKKDALEVWDAKIVEYPAGIDGLLESHPIGDYDLVLRVRRPVTQKATCLELKSFAGRTAANATLKADNASWNRVSLLFDPQLKEAERKVNAVCQFKPEARPSNPVVCRAPQTEPTPELVAFKMSLHRDLLRGTGFYHSLLEYSNRSLDVSQFLSDAVELTRLDNVASPMTRLQLPELPVVNLLNANEDYMKALMEEVRPEDRKRFREYFSKRQLGLGVITAPAGFGKTTALAVATLGMQASIGRIYCSASTHVAIDNFAARLTALDLAIVQRYNKDKQANDPTRAHYKLIVRGCKPEDERVAFCTLLEKPDEGDNAAPVSAWRGVSRWKLNQSLSFWLLRVLRSPAVAPLDADDSLALFELQRDLDKDPLTKQLRDVAADSTQWASFWSRDPKRMEVIYSQIKTLMERILAKTDLLCTTSGLSDKLPYNKWKYQQAQGIAVDEAANMNRPDLYCLWGNCLLPCLLAGDEKQLEPAIMTDEELDASGNFHSRHPYDARISPLAHFKQTGWPIYRMKVQYRMAKGLFTLSKREVYKDLPFDYAPRCDVALHPLGQQLEQFLLANHPTIAPSTAGELDAAWIHCEDTTAVRNPVTGSRMNQGQNKIALDFIKKLVGTTNVKPSNVVMITPYKLNAGSIEKMRKRNYPMLAGMEAAATVDSFHGREGDIVVVVMVTTKETGPAFTKNANRLNVMLSRQRSGLVVFGDLNVTGKLEAWRKGKLEGKGDLVKAVGADGNMHWMKAQTLGNVMRWFVQTGRVATVVHT